MKKYLIWIYSCFFSLALSGQGIFNENIVKNSIVLHEYEINTSSFEFSPVFFDQYIGFVNDKDDVLNFDDVYNTPYFDLVFAAKNTLGNLARKASFPVQLSSELQEGPFCFLNNYSTILFTRTDPLSGLLKIYSSQYNNGEWSEGIQLNLIDKDYHACHPSVSQDGQTLVFAGASSDDGSDMELYTAERSTAGWSNVVRMHEGINSRGNDWFPRFVGDSIILFSSVRAEGNGGLDIYATKKINGQWSLPEIAPAPINGEADDFGMIVGHQIAYFSSDRQGSVGKDDLYRIEFKGNLFYNEGDRMASLAILVKDKLTLLPIEGARISATPSVKSLEDVNLSEYQIDLITEEGSQGEILLKLKPKGVSPIDVGLTDIDGSSQLAIKKGQSYILELSAEGYDNHTVVYDPNTLGNEITLVLEPNEGINNNELSIPTETGSVIVFENIYYDFNSHIILEGAGKELDLLAVTMTQNPNMVVELSAHTDSRGTSLYNQRLSEKRAASARDYLIRKGISPSRITTRGYGESQLRNHCDDRTPCSEEEHSFNRRTEVRVISN